MRFLDRFRREKEDETSRVARLLRTGRIVEGSVLDGVFDASGTITRIFYTYNISGVSYESSQTLNPDQRRRKADYAPGARVTIRYDPRRPANSIVV